MVLLPAASTLGAAAHRPRAAGLVGARAAHHALGRLPRRAPRDGVGPPPRALDARHRAGRLAAARRPHLRPGGLRRDLRAPRLGLRPARRGRVGGLRRRRLRDPGGLEPARDAARLRRHGAALRVARRRRPRRGIALGVPRGRRLRRGGGVPPREGDARLDARDGPPPRRRGGVPPRDPGVRRDGGRRDGALLPRRGAGGDRRGADRDLQPRLVPDAPRDPAPHRGGLRARGGGRGAAARPRLQGALRVDARRRRGDGDVRLRGLHDLHRRVGRHDPRPRGSPAPGAPRGRVPGGLLGRPRHRLRLARPPLPAVAPGHPLRGRRAGADRAALHRRACSRGCS